MLDNRELQVKICRLNFLKILLSRLITQLEKRKAAYTQINSLFGFLTNLHSITSEDISKKVKRLIAAYPTDLEESLEIECKHFAAYLRVKKIDKITAQGICRLLHENNLI